MVLHLVASRSSSPQDLLTAMKWIADSSHYLLRKRRHKPGLGEHMARCFNMIAGYIAIIFNNESAICLKQNSFEGK